MTSKAGDVGDNGGMTCEGKFSRGGVEYAGGMKVWEGDVENSCGMEVSKGGVEYSGGMEVLSVERPEARPPSQRPSRPRSRPPPLPLPRPQIRCILTTMDDA